jgi:hypothetical protein
MHQLVTVWLKSLSVMGCYVGYTAYLISIA